MRIWQDIVCAKKSFRFILALMKLRMKIMLQSFVSGVYMFMDCAKRLVCMENEVHSQSDKIFNSDE